MKTYLLLIGLTIAAFGAGRATVSPVRLPPTMSRQCLIVNNNLDYRWRLPARYEEPPVTLSKDGKPLQAQTNDLGEWRFIDPTLVRKTSEFSNWFMFREKSPDVIYEWNWSGASWDEVNAVAMWNDPDHIAVLDPAQAGEVEPMQKHLWEKNDQGEFRWVRYVRPQGDGQVSLADYVPPPFPKGMTVIQKMRFDLANAIWP